MHIIRLCLSVFVLVSLRIVEKECWSLAYSVLVSIRYSVFVFGSESDWESMGSWFETRPGNIFSWRFIMKWFLRSFSPSADSRRAVVCFWRKYVRLVLVNHLEKLNLPRNSVIRLLTTGYIWTNPVVGVGGASRSAWYRCLNKGLRNIPWTVCSEYKNTGTVFTVFPTKSTPFHYVVSLYFTPNHSVFLFVFFISDLRKPTPFPTKMPLLLS